MVQYIKVDFNFSILLVLLFHNIKGEGMEYINNNGEIINNDKVNEQPKARKLLALIIISAIFLLLTAVMLLTGLIDALNNDGDAETVGLVFYYVFIVLVFGIIGNSIALIPALIGLIYTIVKSKQVSVKKQLILYIVLTVLPILSQTIFMIITARLI